MAAMVIVNNPGSWQSVYPPLRHAEWHGCTPTDLVFPFFLFAVGTALAMSKAGAADRRAWLRMARRATVLFGLGLLLNASATLITRDFDPAHLRIMGVLQRIALCYALAFALTRLLGVRGQAAIALAILIGYWVLLRWLPFPERSPIDPLDRAANLPAWLDRTLLGADHLYKRGPMDPEGLLSTLPATVTTLLGYWCGLLLAACREQPRRVHRLPIAGGLAVGVGLVWTLAGFPLNKALWTSSYVLFTAGCAAIILWLCILAADRGGSFTQRACRPLQVLGVNAILLFVGSGLLARALAALAITDGESPVPLNRWLYEHGPLRVASPMNASLLYALATLAAWWIVLYVCWRQRLFWKV